ncbi:MAG: RDD family protein [Sphingobacteriales bacterium]|nr:MAG: RDD family protein [Sphingobacteriales bacterium]
MINNYYILQNNEQTGPFTHEELMDMGIKGDTFVLSPLAAEWQHAASLPEFHIFFHSQGIYVPTQTNQAGFWWRLLAYIIDSVILTMLTSAPTFIMEVINGVTESAVTEAVGNYFNVIYLFAYLLYHPTCEASNMRGSFGKMICKLAVVDSSGQRISFFHAVGRNLGKILSS